MRKRLVAGLFIVGSLATAGAVTYAFNDKGMIVHNGKPICVDWHGWTEHQLHGDPPYGPFPYSCDVPQK